LEKKIDLDEINLEFIELILNTLEYFQIFKLCIFVCNRYKIVDRISRYLVSVALKFSVMESRKKGLNLEYLGPTAQK
jgi:hypothetical protein